MSMKALNKIDKFYVLLLVILVLLMGPVIYAAKSIFSAFFTAYDVDTNVGKQLRLEKMKLDEAVEWVYDKDVDLIVVKDSQEVQDIEENANNETNEEQGI